MKYLRSLICLAALGGCASALLSLGQSLPLPSPGAVVYTDPVLAIAAVTRVAALVLCAYLAIMLLFSLLAAATGASLLLRIDSLITPAVVRRLTGAALAATIASSSTAAYATEDVPTLRRAQDTPLMRKLDPAVTSTTTTTAVAPAPGPTTTPSVRTTPTSPAPAADVERVVVDLSEGEHVVRRGDNFWSIAESRLPGASMAEVHAYWTQLIDANRSQLSDPSNPDLLRPGQTLVLPKI